jgi:hypothetical protein
MSYQTRIDPEKGVPVLTTLGFCQKVADQEGCTPAEAYDRTFGDLYRALEEDEKRVAVEWRKPEVALKMLQEANAEEQQAWEEDWMYVTQHPEGMPWGGTFDPGPRPLTIVEVIEVVDVNYSERMREHGGGLTARVMVAEDRHVYVVRYFESDWTEPHGERMGECGIEWLSAEL